MILVMDCAGERRGWVSLYWVDRCLGAEAQWACGVLAVRFTQKSLSLFFFLSFFFSSCVLFL
jgi:hypothetical protein